MKQFYVLLSAIFLMPLFLSAQSNYKPGYVVSLNGDTLRGYINYKEWEKNPSLVLFKAGLDKAAESYTVKNANGFAITGFEYFRRFNVSISQDQVEMSNIRQGIDTDHINAEVFLRVLTTGKNVTLYGYRDNIKARYYVADNTMDKPAELIYRVYYRGDDVQIVQTDYNYRSQLQLLAKKYNTINDKFQVDILTAQYSEADIIKIIQKINGDTNEQLTPKGRQGFRPYVGIGVSYNDLGFTGSISYPANNSIAPLIDAGFDLFLNRNIQRVSIRLDVSYTSNHHAFSNGPFPDGYSSNLSNVIQHIVAVTPLIFYNIYNGDNLKLFVEGGAALNFASYNKFYFTENISNTATIVSPQFPELVSFWAAIPLKAGVSINKKVELYIGYTFKTAITNTNEYSANSTTYQAGINYLFNL